ncbi:MAG: FAD-binding oxidoreductase, partial [Desulfobacterota bacterium]|nr:FAD-binding oxidoreductase [Thermodesulfobacteriota bacterium]
MDTSSKLSEIVGAENFTADPVRLRAYETDFSYTPAGAANFAVKPGSSEEVAAVIRYCQEKGIPVVPCSSKVHFFGATIPKEGGVILDMSRMNRILEIDADNRRVRIEAGVTWGQLT